MKWAQKESRSDSIRNRHPLIVPSTLQLYTSLVQKPSVSCMIHFMKYYWILKCSSKIIYVTEKTDVWTMETSCKEATWLPYTRKLPTKAIFTLLENYLANSRADLSSSGRNPCMQMLQIGMSSNYCFVSSWNSRMRLSECSSPELSHWHLTIITLALQLVLENIYTRLCILGVKTEVQGCSVVCQNLLSAIAKCLTAGPLVGSA